jgi:hypothetical protein
MFTQWSLTLLTAFFVSRSQFTYRAVVRTQRCRPQCHVSWQHTVRLLLCVRRNFCGSGDTVDLFWTRR